MSLNIQENGKLNTFGTSNPPDEELSLDSRNSVENKAVTAALQQIDHDIEQLLQLRGDLTKAGLVQLTDALDVTDTSGKALAATENNPSINGTLRNIAQNAIDIARGDVTYRDFSGGIAEAIKSVLDNADFTNKKTKVFQISDDQNVKYITLVATDIGGGNYVGYAMHYGVTNSLWFIHYIKNDTRALEYFEVNYTRKTA